MRAPKLLPTRLLIAGLMLSSALLFAVIQHMMMVSGGKELTFAAQGFDPRALLRGHYAQVAYAISRPNLEAPPALSTKAWQPVWVTIVPAEGDWSVQSVAAAKPDAAPAGGHLVLADAKGWGSGLQLRYGIERIYAQQKEAEAIEHAVRGGPDGDSEIKVVAALGSDGRLRLKAVIVDGTRTNFAWW